MKVWAHGYYRSLPDGGNEFAVMEVAGPDIRASLGLANEFGWATGYMLLALASYFISSWFYVQLVVMIVGLFLVVGLW